MQHKGIWMANEDAKINYFLTAIKQQLGVCFSKHAAHEIMTTAGEKHMSGKKKKQKLFGVSLGTECIISS